MGCATIRTMNDNETFKVNDRVYVDPNVSLNEQTAFIDQLRQAQQDSNEQITSATKALGSDLPTSMGGLTGAGGTWRARYQTPQVESTIADLRAAAQAQALNEQLSNELAQKQQLYKQAYRAASKKKEQEEKATESGGLKVDTNEGQSKGTSLQTAYDPIGNPLPADVSAYDLSGQGEDGLNEALNRINGIKGGGQLPNTGGYGIKFNYKGRQYPAVVYSSGGQIIGVETPFASYNGAAGEKFLTDSVANGGKIIDANNDKDITSIWKLIVK